MTKLKIFKAGAITIVVLGVLHLIGQASSKLADPQGLALLEAMENYKIKMLGEHSVLKFFKGFSTTMGVLIIAFGAQNLLLATAIVKSKRNIASTILITAISFVLAVTYFHALAYGMLLLAFICFIVAFFRKGDYEV